MADRRSNAAGRSTGAPGPRWRRSRAWATVGLVAVVAAAVLWIAEHDGIMSGIQRGYARIASGALNLLGHRTSVVGSTVASSQFGISVVAACTGLFATGLFLVAVAAYPVRARAKLVGSAIGIAGIFVVNIVRLVSLYYVGIHWPSALYAAHQLVWQSVLIVFAVGLWLVWAGRARPARRGAR